MQTHLIKVTYPNGEFFEFKIITDDLANVINLFPREFIINSIERIVPEEPSKKVDLEKVKVDLEKKKYSLRKQFAKDLRNNLMNEIDLLYTKFSLPMWQAQVIDVFIDNELKKWVKS